MGSRKFVSLKTLALALAAAGMLGACAHTTQPLDPEIHSPEDAEVWETVSGSLPPPAAADWKKYNGRKKYVGNGNCVALVLDAVPPLGNTANWARGSHVYGNDELEPGTPIATFDESGAYGNHERGRSHAALYLRQSAAGIYVIDQWRPTRKSRGQKPKVRFIPWLGSRSGLPANTGVAYYVIHTLNSNDRAIASEDPGVR